MATSSSLNLHYSSTILNAVCEIWSQNLKNLPGREGKEGGEPEGGGEAGREGDGWSNFITYSQTGFTKVVYLNHWESFKNTELSKPALDTKWLPRLQDAVYSLKAPQ